MPLDGRLRIVDGRIPEDEGVTIIHARSVAENVVFEQDGLPMNGMLVLTNGKPDDMSIQITGDSRIHSAPLTAEAFKRGFIGDKGEYIVSIGLLLFAFSTVISWSYYGDRAITYLLGIKFVVPYRIIYIIAFFVGALIDTTVVWNFANIAIVIMALPNLFGILVLHKEMKQSIFDYWEKFKVEHPDFARKLKLIE